MTSLLQSLFSRVVILTGILFLVASCATYSPRVDPLIGEWSYTMRQLPDGDAEGTMVLSSGGDGYVGLLQSAEGNMEIRDLIIEDNEIVSGHFIGRGYHVELRGEFEGDEFKGTIAAQGREFDMVAVKLEQ